MRLWARGCGQRRTALRVEHAGVGKRQIGLDDQLMLADITLLESGIRVGKPRDVGIGLHDIVP